jgi:hypothetical protein
MPRTTQDQTSVGRSNKGTLFGAETDDILLPVGAGLSDTLMRQGSSGVGTGVN